MSSTTQVPCLPGKGGGTRLVGFYRGAVFAVKAPRFGNLAPRRAASRQDGAAHVLDREKVRAQACDLERFLPARFQVEVFFDR